MGITTRVIEARMVKQKGRSGRVFEVGFVRELVSEQEEVNTSCNLQVTFFQPRPQVSST